MGVKQTFRKVLRALFRYSQCGKVGSCLDTSENRYSYKCLLESFTSSYFSFFCVLLLSSTYERVNRVFFFCKMWYIKWLLETNIIPSKICGRRTDISSFVQVHGGGWISQSYLKCSCYIYVCNKQHCIWGRRSCLKSVISPDIIK